MIILQTVLSILWLIRIVFNIMSFAHVWWVKEYRWDRMWIHLSTPQGKRMYVLPWRRPRISPKSISLVALSLGVLFLMFKQFGFGFVTLLIADVLSFPITFVFVALINIPVMVYHQMVIYRAREMLRQHVPMTVVGITGSFGKTSTKEYLSTMLSSAYKTLKTAASKNSPIGISEVVLSHLQSDHQLFVVEMGAYKKGEIAYMSGLVKPEIAIITAINAQHQDLFGTIENTMKAKYELISGLSGKRIAICNADDSQVREMGAWAKRDGVHVWWYGTQENMPDGDHTFAALDIQTDRTGVRFTCNGELVQAPLIGAHQVSNLLAALAGCVACGMPIHDAAVAALHIKPIHGVLEKIPGTKGFTLIDDTFNNNPDAAKAAIDVLSKEKKKRILVFQPMIELGSYAKALHEEVGAYAARQADLIILTNANWSDNFISGVRKESKTLPVMIQDGEKAAGSIMKFAPSGGTLLGKGKEAARVLGYFRKSA